jgi:putative selenium metabolism protein SsnA
MLITNAKIITWTKPNNIFEGYTIRVKDGKIADIGLCADIKEKYPEEEEVDAHSHFVMPGNICSHTHFYGALARGLSVPGSEPKDFPEILKKLWWPLDRSLDGDAIRLSALVCIVDAIKHGTTSLLDHHASQNSIRGSLNIIADVVEKSGLRASLCYEVTDRGGEKKADLGIIENTEFINRIKREGNLNGRLAAIFGLHASLTLSEKTLAKCRNRVAEDVGFHIHVAEHSIDEYDSLEKSKKRVIDRLLYHGILGDRSILVHAVHIDPKEMEIIADTQTWVTHQPRSNMNNGVGLPMVEGMLRMGIKVCLGNDGFSNSMWEEWKTTYLVHKLGNLDPRRMNGNDVIKMAVYNNSELVSLLFSRNIGSIEIGSEADLIFVDYHPFTPVTSENIPWHILFGFNESMVTATMVAGEFLMKERRLLTLDEEKIAYDANRIAPEVWKRYEIQCAGER